MAAQRKSGTGRAVAVRRAGPADHGAALPLFLAFYKEEGFPGALDGLSANLAAAIAREDTAVFLAFAGDRAVGAAACSSSFGLEVGLYGELEDLYVLPAWRGRGIASQLVEAACDWARAKGCSDMEIVMTPHAQANEALKAWYRERGFKDTGRIICERLLRTDAQAGGQVQ